MADYDLTILNTVTPQEAVSQTGDRAVSPTELVLEKDLVITEQADHSSTVVAGFGLLWVRSDSPNVLVFTDDAGTDFDISVAGGGGFTSFVDDETNSNYAIGLNALDSISVGSGLSNVAFGKDSGTAITIGDENTLFGNLSGASLIGGLKNTFVGFASGDSVISSNRNTGIGWAALSGVASDDNTCVGYLAMPNGTGTDNAIFGSSAGASLTSGSTNTLFGKDAGTGVTTGDRNIVVGDIIGISTTSYSVLIGASGSTSGGNTSDQLVIGFNNFVQNASIEGYQAARSDVDHSGKVLTITGPSAFAGAGSNQTGGNLVLQGGLKASGGGANGLIILNNIPTSDPSVAGALWNSSGTLMISAG